MEIFCENLCRIFQENKTEQDLYLKTAYNVFIIGYQQSGKSTLANLLSDQENLYFEKEGNNQFIPINNNYFPITQEDGIGTQKAKSIIKGDFQIWDFPGYGLGEDATKEIEKRIEQIVTINKSPAAHIIIVFPYTQFSQDRGQNIIQLLNLIAQEGLAASIVISKVPSKVEVEKFVTDFETQLNQKQISYNKEAKQLVSQIIQDKRISILHYPSQIEGYQQFKAENIKQLKDLVYNQKYFQKVNMKIKFLANDQTKINEFSSQLQNKLKETEAQLINILININFYKIQQQLSGAEYQKIQELKQEYDILRSQKQNYLEYYEQLQKISQLEDWNNSIFEQQELKISDTIFSVNVKIFNNTLSVDCASYSTRQLKEVYQSNENIKEIYIHSLFEFVVDCDINMLGVHIYIKCKVFRVLKQSIINLKGQAGEPITSKARDGDETNIHGDVGQNGNRGHPGGIFYVDAAEYQDTYLLTIDISGGDGGNGQNGGDGLDGKKGENGDENEVLDRKESCLEDVVMAPYNFIKRLYQLNREIIYNYRSLGKPGSVGGDAGSGGNGGVVGNKGLGIFKTLDQINLIENNNKCGQDGCQGIIGAGGQYGTDYVGQYFEVKLYGIIRKDDEQQEVIEDDKNQDNQQNQNDEIVIQCDEILENEEKDEQDESNRNDEKKQNQKLKKDKKNDENNLAVAGGAVGVGVVGGGLALTLLATSFIPGFGAGIVIGVGLYGIFSGAAKLIKEGWHYTKFDEENNRFSPSGKLKQSFQWNYQDQGNQGLQENLKKSINNFETEQKIRIDQISKELRLVKIEENSILKIIFGQQE